MEIQELFIGAWVNFLRYVDGTTIEEPHRVTGIMSYNETWCIQTDASDSYYDIDSFAPIGVTDDIMAHSGFILDLGSATYRLTGNRWLEYRFKDAMLVEWWNNGQVGLEIISQCPCRCTHQLQAALRLCGSEIEITL